MQVNIPIIISNIFLNICILEVKLQLRITNKCVLIIMIKNKNKLKMYKNIKHFYMF